MSKIHNTGREQPKETAQDGGQSTKVSQKKREAHLTEPPRRKKLSAVKDCEVIEALTKSV